MNEQNKRGRPLKYLTAERFERFLRNDFWHLQNRVRLSLWLSGAILVALIGKLAIDFFG